MTEGVEVPTKKGLPTLAWVGIGCAVLIVIVLAVLLAGGLFMAKKVKDVAGDLDFEGDPAMSAARLIVRMNPELEEVDADEESGTITVRHKESGKTVTVNVEDIKEGRIRFTTDEGEVLIQADGDPEEGTISVTSEDKTWTLKTGVESAAEVPDWIPVFRDSEVENPHSIVTDGGTSGGYQLRSDEAVDVLVDFYRSELESHGFAVRVNSFSSSDDEAGAVVSATDEVSSRGVTVMVRSDVDGSTHVAVSYQEGD